jgi:hypothetical protein
MKRLGTVVAGLIIFVAAVMSMDQAGGPTTVFHGIVIGTGVVPTDTGPPRQVATVSLSDGAKVQARVSTPLIVSAGQSVRVNEYSGIMAGRKTYEVVAVEGAK